jgi:hypothetical protein
LGDRADKDRCGNGDMVRTCAVLVLCALSMVAGVVLGVVGYLWVSVCP